MNYKDKFGGETIQAVQFKDNIGSANEILKFIGRHTLYTDTGYSACYSLLHTEGIEIEPGRRVHIGEFVAKYSDGSIHVFKEDEFRKYYKSADNTGSIKVQLDLDTHEYDALLAEAKQTADKLNGMLRKLKNFRVDTIQSNDRLHCTCVLKPDE